MSAPPAPSGRLTAGQEAWRMVVVALSGVVLWVFSFSAEVSPTSWWPAVDLAVGVPAVLAVHWRRRWPLAVALGTARATAVSGVAAVAALLAFVSLVTTRRWRQVVVVGLALMGAAWLSDLLLTPTAADPLPWWTSIAATAAVLGGAVVVGLYVRARRDLREADRQRAATAEREQAARLDQVRMGERTRIAREMHDVLAHRISLVSLHAGAMAYRTDLSADELRASAVVVQENAHLALQELRDVLGVLRDPDPGSPVGPSSGTAPPQPTLAELPALLEEARAAGTPVRLEGPLPPSAPQHQTAGRTAYRIVQESLTNVRKHAPGSSVQLGLRLRDDRLEIVVSNPLRPAPVGADHGTTIPGAGDGARRPSGAGLGLVGLAERAELAGGRLEHGAHGSRYELRAWLPWPT